MRDTRLAGWSDCHVETTNDGPFGLWMVARIAWWFFG